MDRLRQEALPECPVFAVLHYEVNGAPFGRAGPQQFDDIGVADILQELVLRQKVAQFCRSAVVFQHLHRHRSVPCCKRAREVEKRIDEANSRKLQAKICLNVIILFNIHISIDSSCFHFEIL